MLSCGVFFPPKYLLPLLCDAPSLKSFLRVLFFLCPFPFRAGRESISQHMRTGLLQQCLLEWSSEEDSHSSLLCCCPPAHGPASGIAAAGCSASPKAPQHLVLWLPLAHTPLSLWTRVAQPQSTQCAGNIHYLYVEHILLPSQLFVLWKCFWDVIQEFPDEAVFPAGCPQGVGTAMQDGMEMLI